MANTQNKVAKDYTPYAVADVKYLNAAEQFASW